MPNAAVGDIAKVALYQTLYGQRVLNVFHYRLAEIVGTHPQSTVLQELATKFADETAVNGVVNEMRSNVSEDLMFDLVRTQMVHPLPTVYRQSVIALPGLIAQPAGTSNVALSITLKTERFGRRGLGRKQIAGIDQAGYEGGFLTALSLTAFAVVGQAMELPIETTTGTCVWVPVIYHGPSFEVPYDVVTDSVVQDTVRDMRRRTVRLGE